MIKAEKSETAKKEEGGRYGQIKVCKWGHRDAAQIDDGGHLGCGADGMLTDEIVLLPSSGYVHSDEERDVSARARALEFGEGTCKTGTCSTTAPASLFSALQKA